MAGIGIDDVSGHCGGMKPSLTRTIPLSLAVILGACVPRPAPTPPVETAPPPVSPAPVPTPVQVQDDWLDAPQTAGDWSYRTRAAGGGVASFGRFGVTSDEPLFTMTCERDTRAILLARTGSSTGATTARMVVRTETLTRTLAASGTRPTASGRGAATVARLVASDRLLDAMALTKGRFAIEVDGREPLYIPSWAEVTRVIEDCR